MRSALLGLATCALLACGGHAPSAVVEDPVAREAPPPAAVVLPVIHGLPVWPEPIVDAPPEVREVWARFQAVLARTLEPPTDASVTAWRDVTLVPWVRESMRVLGELHAHARPLEESSDVRARVLAHVVLAAGVEHVLMQIRTLSVPYALQADARVELEVGMLRSVLASSVATHAVSAYERCASEAAARPIMAEWATRCAERRQALADIAERLPGRSLAEAELPEECRGDAPAEEPTVAHDHDAPAELALVYHGDLAGDDRDRLLAAVERRIAALDWMRLLPRDEVRAAEALVAQRRSRDDGPTCGQPPTLEAVLAQRHPNVYVGYLSTVCEPSAEEGAEPVLTCALEVQGGSLPRVFELRSPIGAPPVDAARSIDAAARLAVRSDDFILGMTVDHSSRGALIRDGVALLGVEPADPSLRIAPTFGDARRALLACLDRPGIASATIAWTISRDGAGSDVVVSPITTPDGTDRDALARCLRTAITALPWPCPRSSEPVHVEARLCARR